MNVGLSFVSGGQTGVDRATLDVAMKWRLPYHGWCPAGRWAEDGRIPDQYVLRVTPQAEPAQRTVWNVRDSDALFILGEFPRSEGTLLAQRTAEELGRPVHHAMPEERAEATCEWLIALGGRCALNVAGPRESEQPGIYQAAYTFLEALVKCYFTAETSAS
ncbi:MAG: putative molybdenum carrier protein [Bacteroidota bacterium]|nr:putative molybdenum carrier protein [Bacteroidota bacterium]